MTTCKESEQIILQHVSCQRNAWLSTWFANVFHMKGELWCISAPAAVKSLTAPDQASPWPSLKEGPPTSHYGAHTESRTTSALRRNNARPAEKSGGGSEWTRAVIAYIMIRALAMEKKQNWKAKKMHFRNYKEWKKRHEENKETWASLSAPGCLSGHATCTLHLDFIPHWDS